MQRGFPNEAEEYLLFGYPDTEILDCEFMHQVFRTSGEEIQDIIDIACGTGRHAIEMAKKGYQVTGIDISNHMLEAARRKAQEEQVSIQFLQIDMKALDFMDGFDAAYILFNTATLLIDNEDLIQFMNGIHAALKSRGLLVVEVNNLWPVIAIGRLQNQIFHWDEEREGIRRARQTEIVIGPYNNIMAHHERKRYWREETELEPRADTFYTRIFSLNEFDLLCRLTGFRIRDVYGATDINSRIEHPNTTTRRDSPYRNYVFVVEKVVPTIKKEDFEGNPRSTTQPSG